MKFNLRYLPLAIALGGIAIAICLLSLPAVAQEAAAAPGGDDEAQPPIREQNIYIPYEKLRQVFEKHGRGVFLPYEKFQELWQAARDKTAPAAEQEPPVKAIISEIENEATVAKDVVRVQALLKIEVLAEGWNQIPLRLADSAITAATIGDRPARIVGGPGRNYALLIEKKGKQPEQIELKLEYAKAINKMPGRNSVSFQAPQAPVSRWRVRIPQSGVKVEIHPLIAATEVPVGEPDDPQAPGPDETVMLAFVGAAPVVRIDWTPKSEGATGLAALASVQAEQQVWINEGVMRTRSDLEYTISRAELGQLAILVPAGQKVVNVFDANVRQWSVEPLAAEGDQPAGQKITAELFEPAKGSQRVTVELEKFSGDKLQQAIQVPVVKVLEVGRQQGVVVVQVASGLRAEATRRSGLFQVDKSELPEALRGGNWAFSYRYASVPFELELSVEKVQPRILVDSLVEAYLEPEKLSLDMASIYTVERAGVFRLQLDVPAGYEVRQVRGRALAGAAAAEVDSHHLEGQQNTRLVVNLGRKALGRVGLVVELEKDLDEPDLLSPTGKAADIPVPIPRIAADSVERAVGRLIVYAPESLLVNPAKADGLRSVPFAEALQGMQSARGAKPAGLRPVLAFAYSQEPAELELAAERRRPQTTIRQLLVARIEDGVAKYESTLFYEILYSGVKSLRIDVPAEVAADLRVETPGFREKAIDPVPDDLAQGHIAWSLSGESELLGEGQIKLVWEKKIEKLDVGKSVELIVPHLKPAGVDRAWGQIVLAKAETLDVRESGELKELRPIDPQHDLMAAVAGAARAFEFHKDWALNITATRYELEEVKRTNIELGVVRMVVTRGRRISVQALYRMRSARQRLVVKLPVPKPPEKIHFDTAPLRIDGRPVTLEHGQQGQYYVPLVDSDPSKPFLLELRYTVPGDGSRLQLPGFPEEPAAQKIYLCAYLPEEWTLLGAAGPWTEEFQWELDPALNWRPDPYWGAEYLIDQVCSGIEIGDDPAENFQTDGKLYVFSTLRPQAPPAGSLRLKSVGQTGLHAGMFIVVILIGLLLLPTDRSMRALAIGALIVVLVLCGVFAPILALQLLNGVLASAIFVVLVIWVVVYFLRKRPVTAIASPPVQPPLPPAASAAEKADQQRPSDAAKEEPPPADAPSPDRQDDSKEGGQTDA